MLKRGVEFWSDTGRRKGHTRLAVVFDPAIRREHHRLVAQGESVKRMVAAPTHDRSHDIVQTGKLI